MSQLSGDVDTSMVDSTPLSFSFSSTSSEDAFIKRALLIYFVMMLFLLSPFYSITGMIG